MMSAIWRHTIQEREGFVHFAKPPKTSYPTEIGKGVTVKNTADCLRTLTLSLRAGVSSHQK